MPPPTVRYLDVFDDRSSRGALRRNVPQIAAQLLPGHVRSALFLHVAGLSLLDVTVSLDPNLFRPARDAFG